VALYLLVATMPAAVYDAISFYYDHQEEIDQFIAESSLEAHAEQ
jgi:hypothetical protein